MSGSLTSDETPLVALLRTWQSHTRELLADVRPRPHPEGVLPAEELADERSKQLDEELTSFIEQVLDYLRCEQQLLPRIATQVPTAEQDEAMRRLTAPKRWPVVQPHPDLPRTPWLASAVEPVAALLDRLRDRLSTAPG